MSDAPAQQERTTALATNRVALVEWAAPPPSGIVVDGAAPFEWLGRASIIAIGTGAVIEWAGTAANNLVSLEWLQSVQSDDSPQIEWPFTAIASDDSAPVEWLGSAMLEDTPAVISWQAGGLLDSIGYIEWQPGVLTFPLTYIQWPALVAALTSYLQETGDLDFAAALTTIVANAELRIYRELDFLATHGTNRSLSMTAGSRVLSILPTTGQTVASLPVAIAYPIIVEGITALVTKGAFPATDDAGNLSTDESGNPIYTGTGFVRTRLQRCSLDMIDAIWPDETQTGAPGQPFAYFAMIDHTTAVIAPTPDQAYAVEIVGTWRPAPMSATNPRTWLGDNLPDLFFAACMVEACGYQRDYGAQSDDPKIAQSWEARYVALRQGAISEEMRRKSERPPSAPPAPPGRPG